MKAPATAPTPAADTAAPVLLGDAAGRLAPVQHSGQLELAAQLSRAAALGGRLAAERDGMAPSADAVARLEHLHLRAERRAESEGRWRACLFGRRR